MLNFIQLQIIDFIYLLSTSKKYDKVFKMKKVAEVRKLLTKANNFSLCPTIM